jgi:3-hydroxyacyl-[acyl-carrier-protein] dehydratase
MELNRDQIKAIIPHREPFLLIDGITEVTPLVSAIGFKDVTTNEFWVPGHFPSEPVMPGVLIIESIAQVGAVCLLIADQFKGKIAYFAKIENVKFRKKVVPGDRLILKATLTQYRSSFGVAEGIATVNGDVVASATCYFAISQ